MSNPDLATNLTTDRADTSFGAIDDVSGTPIAESRVEAEAAVASQWQLIWWRFVKHKVALASGLLIVALYLLAIFAEFFAPYEPNDRNFRNAYMPPQAIHFFSEDGFQLRPFVYGVDRQLSFTTGRAEYSEDRSERHDVKFFITSEPYELLGFIPASIRLFGVENGATIYLWGTDSVGRCMLSQTIHGARISLFIGLLGVFISLILGVTIGGISGYIGGVVDNAIQRVIEIIRAFPSLALWMALAAALPPTWTQMQVYFAIIVILSLIGWTTLAREVRGKMLSLRQEDFITAARLNGCGVMRLLRVHMVPSFTSHVIATLTLAVPAMILAETALSFLGIGLARPIVSWGVLLQQAQNVEALMAAPWLFLPGAVLVVTVLAFNFLGDGLRDAADPYSRHA